MIRLGSAALALILLAPRWALAAACCGGNFSAPALITGDDKALLTSSVSSAAVSDSVDGSGVWQRRSDEFTRALRLDAARLLSDLWQLGASVQVLERTRDTSSGSQSASGLGDTTVNLGYEMLPEWSYSEWRPRGFGYLQVRAPTGKSIYASNDPFMLESQGRGLWSVGAGGIFLKTWVPWDMQVSFDVHRSFARSFESSAAGGRIEVRPGWGESLSLSSGWSRGDLRLGATLTWNYEDPLATSGAVQSAGALQRYMTATISANYLFAPEWAGSLAYSDQSLLGDPINTTLAQTVSVIVQRRWAR